MKPLLLLIALFSVAPTVLATPQSLTKAQEDKILYMLFENQSRKTISADRKETCNKKTPDTWFCRHNTVKKFLIGALGVGLDQRYHREHQVSCEMITPEIKKEILQRTQQEMMSVDLRREAGLALNGQWLCTYKFMTVDRSAVPAEEITAKPVGFDPQSAGISFLMNRDLNRIISRQIIVWRAN